MVNKQSQAVFYGSLWLFMVDMVDSAKFTISTFIGSVVNNP